MTAISASLHTIPLLSALTPAQLESVASVCERLTFDADQEIVVAGKQAEAAYFLIDGPVHCLTTVDGESKSTPIPSGATLLELAMIVELDVSATCIARGPAKVLKIPRQQMQDLMQDDIALTDVIIETLTRRLKEMAEAMREASIPFQELEKRAS